MAAASLHKLDGSTRQSVCITALLGVCIGLIAYSHAGLTAQVVTNAPQCRRRLGELSLSAASSLHVRRLSGACSGAGLDAFNSLGGRSGNPILPSCFDTLMQDCGTQCGISLLFNPEEGKACVEECIAPQGFAGTCATCISTFGQCTAANCASLCIAAVDDACYTCVNDNCAQALISCSGLPALSFSVPDFACPSSNVEVSGVFWNVGGSADVTFFSAVEQLYGNNAAFLGTILILASGVKPYAECLLLLVLWFAPLSPRTRGQWLRWINRGSRWSMMDILVVMTMCSAIHFSVVRGSVSVVMETRPAVYTFAVMALLLTPVGEWMTFRAAKHTLATEHDPAHLGCLGRPLCAALDAPLQADAARDRSPLLAVLSLLALGLTAAALFLDYAVQWTIHDKVTNEISHFDLTFAQLMDAAAAPATGSAAGGIFMGVVYGFLVVVAPLSSNLAMVGVALLPKGGRCHRFALRWAQAVNPFNCLDVMLLAALAFASEFDRLVSSLTSSVGCGEGNTAEATIAASAAVGVGFYLAIPAVIVTWPAQVLTAVHGAALEVQQKHITSSNKVVQA